VQTYLAHAKINLGLEILRKRSDGYHEINSLFLPIPLADSLTITPAESGITLECDDSSLPVDATNLCMRASLAMQKYFSIREGVHVTLKKNIPAGAGLGGGSSDAAAMLLMLNTMWNINAPLTTLHEIAATLGADVPFFLYSTPAIIAGIGERVAPLPTSLNHPLLVVFPGINVSTAWAYSHAVCEPERVATDYRKILNANKPLSEYHDLFRNDFEKIIFPRYPELAAIKMRLFTSGAAYASLTGSGSALFAFYDDIVTAQSASNSFPEYKTDFFPQMLSD